jgi:nucleoid-associated protein YgaU
MGLFDFVKDAGEKLFGGGEAAKAKAAAEERARSEAEDMAERQKGQALTRLAATMGLKVEDFKVHYDDGLATLTGTTVSQAEKEKIVLLVGNTQGVARVDDRLRVEKPEPESVMYTVQPGDSLSKIAKAQYGDAMKYMTIFEANKPMLKDPDKIYPGQVLRIPPMKD